MAELRIPPLVEADAEELVEFIAESVGNAKSKGVVIGLSGGLDSATVTKLAVDALGAERVLNIFMPSRVTPAEDYKTTAELSRMWGTEYKIFDIQPAVDALTAVLLSDREAPLERGNISARCRMIVLYNQAKKRDYLVVGTSNQSELMTGYFTKFGDGACDMVPLASMYKTEVRLLADFIGVPKEIIRKPPTAGLWEGQTDEDEMGISYENLDRILYGLELGMAVKGISAETGIPVAKVEEIKALIKSMEHKRLPPLRPMV